MKAIILAGGKGTRLAPYTKILPKPLMPIGDMPILEIILKQMQHAGIDHAVLTVGHLAELLHLFFQDGKRVGMRVTYSYEDEPLGTAGPLALVPGLNETFMVSNGDVLTTINLEELIAFHHEQKATATIAMHQRQTKIDLGVIQLNGGNEVQGYIEKPTYEHMVSMGIYIFEPTVLDYVPRNSYLDFPDLVNMLLKDGKKVVGFPFNGYWMDLGRPDDYEQAVTDFEAMKTQFLPNNSAQKINTN